jgi:hypothetical protein
MSFKLTLSPKVKLKKKSFARNRYWTEGVKKGQIGTIKSTCDKEMAGKQVVYLGRVRGYDWFKLLQDSTTGQYKRGSTFGYMFKWIDW